MIASLEQGQLGIFEQKVNDWIAFQTDEDYGDASAAAHGHKLLREKLKTPLMLTEYVRGVENTANFILAGGTDMVHIDPEYDGGITGARKIAVFCETLGLDVQCHACGPAWPSP